MREQVFLITVWQDDNAVGALKICTPHGVDICRLGGAMNLSGIALPFSELTDTLEGWREGGRDGPMVLTLRWRMERTIPNPPSCDNFVPDGKTR